MVLFLLNVVPLCQASANHISSKNNSTNNNRLVLVESTPLPLSRRLLSSYLRIPYQTLLLKELSFSSQWIVPYTWDLWKVLNLQNLLHWRRLEYLQLFRQAQVEDCVVKEDGVTKHVSREYIFRTRIQWKFRIGYIGWVSSQCGRWLLDRYTPNLRLRMRKVPCWNLVDWDWTM